MNTQLELPESPLELALLQDQIAAKLATVPLTSLTDDDLLRTVETVERAHRRGVGIDARLLVDMSDRNAFRKVGCMSPTAYLSQALRLGPAVAKRRAKVAAAIASMRNMQGELLPPRLPETATGVARGDLSLDHILDTIDIIDQIPHSVPEPDRARAEAQLAIAARELSPAGLRTVGHRLLEHLDPDGTLTDDTDRKRTRGLSIAPQDRRLMSNLKASLTPVLRAKLEALLLLWASPGMNNPDDPESPVGPSTDADPIALTAARDRDFRTPSQRAHDALEAMTDRLTATGSLGTPTSLPAHLVITTTLADLEQRSGVATMVTGSRIPVSDLITLAAASTPWLEVFANRSASILHFGRGRRLASLPQRLALFGRDRGCTAPGCTTSFIHAQAHHIPDWADGGETNIDHLGAACGSHNRSVGKNPDNWETTILHTGPYAGRVGWRPTDSDQPWRVNHVHRPEELLTGDAAAPPTETTSSVRPEWKKRPA